MSKLDRLVFLMLVGFARLFAGRQSAIRFAAWLEPLVGITEDTIELTDDEGGRMSDIDLLAKMGTDASKWLDEYMDRFGDEAPDEGTLLGWFANAIEAGRNAGITEDE